MLDNILPEIVDRAREVFELRGEPEIRRIDTRHYPYSVVSRIELGSEGDSRVVYLKRATGETTDQDPIKSDIAAEYRILDELYERFRSVPNLSVVRPVALLSGYNVIVTEEAPGPTLMTLVGRAVRQPKHGRTVAAQASTFRSSMPARSIWSRAFWTIGRNTSSGSNICATTTHPTDTSARPNGPCLSSRG